METENAQQQVNQGNSLNQNTRQSPTAIPSEPHVQPWLIVLLIIFFQPLAWYFMSKDKHFHGWFPFLLWVTSVPFIIVETILLLFIVPRLTTLYQQLNSSSPGTISYLGIYAFIVYLLIVITFGIFLMIRVRKFGMLSKPLLWVTITVLALNLIATGIGLATTITSVILPIYNLTNAIIEQPSGISEQNKDETDIRELVSNFYRAFAAENGRLLFTYMTPPVTSQEKREHSWLTGADLGQNAFYRVFLRVKLSNPSIKSINRLNDKTAEVNVQDEFQSYSQSSAEWSKPTIRNVMFTVVKIQTETKQEFWVIDKFTYTGTVTRTYKGTEKYNGFPNLDSN